MERIDKGQLYDQLTALARQTQTLADEVVSLQQQMSAVLQENVELTIENDRLRQTIAAQSQETTSNGLTASRQNLQNLYQEGFHVCNEYYGKRLADAESCTFCLDIIYNDHRMKG